MWPGLGWLRDLIYKNRRYLAKGNRVEIDPSAARLMKKVTIKVRGKDNYLSIGPGADLRNCEIRLTGQGNRIEIGRNVRFKAGKIYLLDTQQQHIRLGQDSTVESAYLLVDERASIDIGEDCMFSTDIVIRTGDKHSIVCASTGERLNCAQDIVIGNHVWLGRAVQVLKGSHIASGSVVGTCSVLTRVYKDANVVLAGIPARVVREGVRWDRDLL